ncbi:hypothetical protein P4O66_015737, partial [Electrophorus voltai]
MPFRALYLAGEYKYFFPFLKKKKQPLMEKVNKEVAEFMNYLQDVSKVCADAYKRLPSGASRYSEEYFKACLDHMKSHPQVYTIQEITSLTGGKFVSDISLNFEKQLLAMGNIEMVEKRMLAEDTQLTVDCDSLSDVISPCEKARRLHTAISSDTNAEKLSATYEPHVCLAKEAFLQLVNNDAGCAEAWELPVWVKSKTAYIDPPLLKTEVTWRERNLLFHEESVKLAYKKTGSNPVFFLTSEDYANKVDFDQKENGSRTVVSFDSTGLDFEVDVTDLESFGESCQPCKRAKDQSEPKAPSTNGKLGLSTHNADLADQNEPQTPSTIGKLGLSTPKADLEEQPSSQPGTEGARDFSSAASTPAEEEVQTEAAQAAAEEGFTEKCADAPLNVGSTRSPPSTVEDHSTLDRPPAKRVRHCSVTSSLQSADSDEEHLVIDYPESLLEGPAKKSQAILAAPESPADSMALSLGEKASELTGPTTPTSPARGGKRGTKRPRVSGHCDQLGQILRMQDAMLKAAPSKGLELPKTQNPAECRGPAGRGSNHPTSLVKPCVSSYLESGEGLQEETCAPAPPKPTAQRTRLLRAELQVSGEDESDYEPPAEASLLYKLYSLQDVLLMVRSSVHIAHPRHDLHVFRAVPVHVLPKLEYQLCYGGESLTHSEACQLWAEQQLHSSTVSFIGRINARTSKVVQLQELPADWIQNTSCDFRPARCLNTLYHILKKVMSLQEGRYLLGHKPGEAFVTVFKATDGKKPSRSAYDLRAAHAGLPVLPADGRLSWLPLDPLHLMPFHIKHRRAPCTFPPRQPKVGRCKMMVSEFLGQLTLNFGSSEPTYPTVVPVPDFDPDKDAARIETAIKTKGVDEQTIIQVLTKRTYGQRREIAFAYEKRAKKDMISALKGALSGSLETVILGLMKSTAQYDASEIKASIKGLGTDEESLIEILCSRSNAELIEIKKVYKELFKKDLEKDVAGDTSGEFAKLLIALVQASHRWSSDHDGGLVKRAEPSSVVDYEKIDEDARALYEAGVKRKGTDVKTWITIFTERSIPHLQKVFERYKSYSPYDMQESIRKEVKGDLEKSFLTLVQCFENKQLYFASRLNDAMKSKGAKEKVVTRIIVSRCEVDLKKIRTEFKAQFGKSLYQTIIGQALGSRQPSPASHPLWCSVWADANAVCT